MKLGKAPRCLCIYGRFRSQAGKARATRVGQHNKAVAVPSRGPALSGTVTGELDFKLARPGFLRLRSDRDSTSSLLVMIMRLGHLPVESLEVEILEYVCHMPGI